MLHKDIQKLVRQPGYIYALFELMREDSFYSIDQFKSTDYSKALNEYELLILWSFYVKTPVSLAYPSSRRKFYRYVKNSREIMKKLQLSYTKKTAHLATHNRKLTNIINKITSPKFHKELNEQVDQKEVINESIHYSGNGAYSQQYLKLAELKYRYDQDWLRTQYGINFEESQDSINLLTKWLTSMLINFRPDIVEVLQKQKVDVKDIKVFFPDIVKRFKQGTLPDNNQYYDLLLLCFATTSDSGVLPQSIIKNFSLDGGVSNNKKYLQINNYTELEAKPLLKAHDNLYIVTSIHNLCRSLYNSPYYWLMGDSDYSKKFTANRGIASEEMAFEILNKVFSKDNIYRNIQVVNKKGQLNTDIDLVCVYGDQAIVFQVKSKMLTLKAKSGDYNQIKIDYQKAVQDAYEQGVKSQLSLLDKNSTLLNTKGERVHLQENLKEVHIVCLTTEEYPGLNTQSVAIDKNDLGPTGVILTIFDLDLLATYLENEYEFVYYIRSRLKLMGIASVANETELLGYHLEHNLNSVDATLVNNIKNHGYVIDQDYHLRTKGFDNSEYLTKKSYINLDCKLILDDINNLENIHQGLPEIIFQLIDLGSDKQRSFSELLIKKKEESIKERTTTEFSVIIEKSEEIIGISYVSSGDNDYQKIKRVAQDYYSAQMVDRGANLWVILGRINDSPNFVDYVIQLKELSVEDLNLNFTSQLNGSYINNQKSSITGNSRCLCGSGRRYRKCCKHRTKK